MDKLAIHGGKPIRDTYLPYSKQCIDDEDIKAVVETLKSDFLTTGPKVLEFEAKFANMVDAKYAVAVSSCTAALHISLMAAGISQGDEVITSPLTFSATSNSVLYASGRPIFADVDINTLNINYVEIKAKITPRTRAIIPVHYSGEPCDMDKILEIAKKHSLIVIEDAAHALGAEYHGKKIGSISDMTCFSLHPVKNITTGEGGVVTTNSKEIYNKLLLFRSHGITRDTYFSISNPWFYEQIELGYNYRITDIQCALGISQLSKLDLYNKRRQEIAEIYNNELSKISGIIINQPLKNIKSSNHLYVIQLDLKKLKTDRNTIFNALRAENIGVNLHYIPVYLHPYYKRLGYNIGLCPNAEKTYSQILTIPLFCSMTQKDIINVISAIKKIMAFYEN